MCPWNSDIKQNDLIDILNYMGGEFYKVVDMTDIHRNNDFIYMISFAYRITVLIKNNFPYYSGLYL